MMRNGAILKIGTTEDLLGEVEGKVWSAVILHSELNELKKRFTVENITQQHGG